MRPALKWAASHRENVVSRPPRCYCYDSSSARVVFEKAGRNWRAHDSAASNQNEARDAAANRNLARERDVCCDICRAPHPRAEN